MSVKRLINYLKIILLIVVSLVFLFPVLCGLMQSIVGSIGIVGGINEVKSLSTDYWSNWFGIHSSFKSIKLTIIIAIVSTFLSLIIAFEYIAIFYNKFNNKFYLLVLFLMLSIPHLSLAMGIHNIYNSSGLVNRIICLFTQCQFPPNGLSNIVPIGMLIYSFVLKETTFLIFITITCLNRINQKKLIQLGQSLGYDNYRIYKVLILPQVYKVIKLPLLMVLSYSVSSVEIPLLFSTTSSRPESIIVYNLFYNPLTVNEYLPGFAGSIWLIVLFGICYIIWLAIEYIMSKIVLLKVYIGNRKPLAYLKHKRVIIIILIFGCWLLPIIIQLVWSIVDSWRFPDLFPNEFKLNNFLSSSNGLLRATYNTTIIGIVASLIGLIGSLLIIENSTRKNIRILNIFAIIAILPTVMPQISFLFGFQIILEYLHLSGSWIAVFWVHCCFCFGYTYFIIKGHQKHLDPRYLQVAYGIGLSKTKTWIRVKFFLLLPAILSAFAIGFSVSFALYLPTLFSSVGRHPTLMTESISLLSSYNPKVSAPYTVILLVLPLILFLLFNSKKTSANNY